MKSKRFCTSFISLCLVGLMVLSGCTPSETKPSSTAPDDSTPTGETSDASTPEGGDTAATGSFDIEAAQTIRPKVLAEAEGIDFPTEDVLTPIWYEKTKVEPDFIVKPDNMEWIQYFQMQSIADTMPEVIAVPNGVIDNDPTYAYLREQKLLRAITAEDVRKYMPRVTAMAEKHWGGITIEDWILGNSHTDGNTYYIPIPPMNVLQTQPEEELYVDSVTYDQSYRPYNWFFRDDILKQIFPESKSEAELRQLYVDNGGKLSFEEVDDVPIHNMQELYDYLTKVKELGMDVNGKPITPIQLQSSSAPDSVWWSTVSLYDQHWQATLLNSDTSLKYFCTDPDWKDYLKWFNRFFNEGLIGQETFIQKDDQRDAKAVNGEYAVFQEWLPIEQARAAAKDEDRGYGYRKVAMFIEEDSLINEYQDMSQKVYTVANNWGVPILTTALSDDDYAQVLNWIDWNMSEEASELRVWGIPEFYEGDGMDRRFKSEYADLEKWALSGETGGKDGIYYGMLVDNIHNSLIGGGTFNYTPTAVYPPDLSDPTKVNIDYAYDYAVRKFYFDKMDLWVISPEAEAGLSDEDKKSYEDLGIEYDEALEEYNKTWTPDYGYDNEAARTAVVKALVGSVEDFDKNYQEFEDKFMTPEFLAEVKKLEDIHLKIMEIEIPLREKIEK
jgi:hypothetical protein